MTGEYFSVNGELRPVAEAVLRLDDVWVVYGYGVYETLKVRNGVLYFPERHAERLLHSARIVELDHPWDEAFVLRALQELVRANRTIDANIKVLLYGGSTREDARLYVLQLAPLFPDRKLYRNGASAILFEGERWKPQAKSLNMLMSAQAYRLAMQAGAYDALLVNRHGQITEGTRTNFWYTDGRRIFTPPADQVLEGVTQMTVLECLKELGMEVVRRPISRDELTSWSGYFLTSTSSKVMPLGRIDQLTFKIPELVRRIMKAYDEWLTRWTGVHAKTCPDEAPRKF